MGGNGSYSKLLGAVPIAKRTHTDTNHRVDGHKVLLQTSNKLQLKTPMNSNSESPIYLIGSKNKHTGDIQISTIAIYKNHRISKTIDLIFDKEGKVVKYNNGNGSHAHQWQTDDKGNLGRKSHDHENTLPIDDNYGELISHIELFNNKHKKS